MDRIVSWSNILIVVMIINTIMDYKTFRLEHNEKSSKIFSFLQPLPRSKRSNRHFVFSKRIRKDTVGREGNDHCPSEHMKIQVICTVFPKLFTLTPRKTSKITLPRRYGVYKSSFYQGQEAWVP